MLSNIVGTMKRLDNRTENGKETKCGGRYLDGYCNGVYTFKVCNVTSKGNCTYVLKMYYFDGPKFISIHDSIMLDLKGNI